MAKEWILNSAMNRFQLNFKRNVGATSESIRKCSPTNIAEWEEYYFSNVRPKEHIVELGKKLYIKITEVIVAEVEEITEQDCINYMLEMVINRTYQGYVTEIKTIYGQLQQEIIDYKIEPASDEWDRLYNVDFFIHVNNHYIGIQIKPVNKGIQLPEIFKEQKIQLKSHQKFKEKFGGEVFYIFSISDSGKKTIVNPEVITEIREEIKRVKLLA